MLWRQELVKDEEGHYKSRKDGEKKKSQLNCSTSAIVQMGKSSKDVRLHQILIFFTQKSDKYPSSFYAKILNRNKQYKEKSDKEKEKSQGCG